MMGNRQKLINGDEFDVVSGWRKYYIWRPGQTAEIKRGMRRRARHEARQQIRESKTECI